jgi:HD-like signal output (HDOD) protein
MPSNARQHHTGHNMFHVQLDQHKPLQGCAHIWDAEVDFDFAQNIADGIGRQLELPDMPDVVVAVEREIKAKYPNMKSIAARIEENAVLAGTLLATVNSPAFQRNLSHHIDVTSIDQCITLIGLERTYRLVVSAAIQNIQHESPLFHDIIAYSAKVATVSTEIAGYLHGVHLETAFLYGLFMHGGMAFLAARYGEKYRPLFEQSLTHPITSYQREVSVFNTLSHDHLGVYVGMKWGLYQHTHNAYLLNEDKAILAAIQWHHHENSGCIRQDLVRNLISVGRLSQGLVNEIILKKYISSEQMQDMQNAILTLGLSEAAMQNIRANMNSWDTNNVTTI